MSIDAKDYQEVARLVEQGHTPDEAMQKVMRKWTGDEYVIEDSSTPFLESVKKQKNKYGAVKTEVDGITFDSKAEARRYEVLKLREQAGEIHTLMLQPRFPLHVIDKQSGEKVRIGYYVGDFMYMEGETMVLEDVKSKPTATPLYKWKKKHVEAEHGIKVTEVS